MRQRRGCSVIIGLGLVLIGAWFLAVQFVPGLEGIIQIEFTWPFILIAVGVFLLLLGVATGAAGLAVPASIVGGLGVLFYFQNASGNWESWSYTWALIPGFVGVGIILAGLLEGAFRQSLSAGGSMIVISLVLFVVFASLLGGLNLLGPYWPALLILLGLWILFRGLLRSR